MLISGGPSRRASSRALCRPREAVQALSGSAGIGTVRRHRLDSTLRRAGRHFAVRFAARSPATPKSRAQPYLIGRPGSCPWLPLRSSRCVALFGSVADAESVAVVGDDAPRVKGRPRFDRGSSVEVAPRRDTEPRRFRAPRSGVRVTKTRAAAAHDELIDRYSEPSSSSSEHDSRASRVRPIGARLAGRVALEHCFVLTTTTVATVVDLRLKPPPTARSEQATTVCRGTRGIDELARSYSRNCSWSIRRTNRSSDLRFGARSRM